LAAPVIGASFLLAACSVPEETPAPARAPNPPPAAPLLAYVSQPIGDPVTGRPWIAHVDVVDLDGDGVPEIITGGFHAHLPFDRMSRVLWWKRK